MAELRKKITVVMCTFNGELFLEEQMESILSQTYKPDEIIVCDDNSDDRTFEIIEQYASTVNYIEWKFYRNEKRLGVRGNFAKAFSLSTGEYIAFADQDDVWVENKLEILYYYLEKGFSLVHSDAELITETGSLINESYSRVSKGHLYEIPMIRRLRGDNNVTGCTCMVNRKLKEQNICFPKYYFFHDGWLALFAYRNGGIAYCNQSLVKYRQHTNNVVGALVKKGRDSYSYSYFKLMAEDYFLLLKERKKIKLTFRETLFVLKIYMNSMCGISFLKHKIKTSLKKSVF